MSDLEKYNAVNACETKEELHSVILSFADENGMIQGRDRKFRAGLMAVGALHYIATGYNLNSMTREFGIRQQAMYIKHYTNKEDL